MHNNKERMFKNSIGMTLIEVVLGMGLIAVMMVIIPNLVVAHQKFSKSSDKKLKAVLIAESYMESLTASEHPPGWEKMTFDQNGNPKFSSVSRATEGGLIVFEEPEDPQNFPNGFWLEKTISNGVPVENVDEILVRVFWREGVDSRYIDLKTYKGVAW